MIRILGVAKTNRKLKVHFRLGVTTKQPIIIDKVDAAADLSWMALFLSLGGHVAQSLINVVRRDLCLMIFACASQAWRTNHGRVIAELPDLFKRL